jgi:hypothetical protein
MQVDIEEDGKVDLSGKHSGNLSKLTNISGHLIGCFVAATRALASRSYSAFLSALFWDLCELKMPPELSKAQRAEKLLKAAQELPDQLTERLKCN